MRDPSPAVQPVVPPAAANARLNGHRVAVVLYGAVALLYWASLYTYVPTLPMYAETLTPDLALIGTILSMYGLWQAFTRLPVGIASDWLGRRKPFIAAGLVLCAGGALLMAGARTPQGLTRARLVDLIREAGRVPVERDALYRPVARPDEVAA